MRAVSPRRALLLVLVTTVAIGCVLPGVFQDTYRQGRNQWSRNRLTGDVTLRDRAPSWQMNCFRRTPRSVFGD